MTATAAQPGWPLEATLALLGLVIGLFGFLAITGAACGEGLLAAFSVAVVGYGAGLALVRRGVRGRGAFWKGLGVILLASVAAGLTGRLLAARIIFKSAFGDVSASGVTVLSTRRFGFQDNTSLLVVKTTWESLKVLLNERGFVPYSKAEEFLDPRPSPYYQEATFRSIVTAGGIFGDLLPFHSDLKVYYREDAHASGTTALPARIITVTWDPKPQLAYVIVAEF